MFEDSYILHSYIPILIWCVYYSGIDKLEFLQSHKNTDIYKKSYNIIDKYFSHDEKHDEDQRIATESTQQGQFAFTVPGEGGDSAHQGPWNF